MICTRRRTLLLFSFAYLFFPPIFAGSLFKVPNPELIYKGSAPGLPEGVLVIRDEKAFHEAVAPLVPDFGGVMPDFKKRTLIRIVGRARENTCRETRLLEVATRNLTATARVEERIPEADCACGKARRPPSAWLVSVGRSIRRARSEITDRVVPCSKTGDGSSQENGKEDLVAQILEGTVSDDSEPGAKMITTSRDYSEACRRLGAGRRCEEIDFSRHRAVMVIGRPRSNGCRKTLLTNASLASPEEVVFQIQEVYPGQGQTCSQIFRDPKAFVYRVPLSVVRARVVTEKKSR